MKNKLLSAVILCLSASLILSSCAKSAPDETTASAEITDKVTEMIIEETAATAPETTVPETEITAETQVLTEKQTEKAAEKTTAKAAVKTTKHAATTSAPKVTKPYEYDMSHPAVRTVMGMVGEKYQCTDVAEAAVNCAGLTGWKTETWTNENGGSSWQKHFCMANFLELGPHVSKSKIQPGDLIYYPPGGSRGLEHIAVYIGNGMAVHGNWEKDGTTRVGKAYFREPKYIIHIDYGR